MGKRARGNNVAVRKLPHQKSLEETISEGIKIVKDELEHFLGSRDKQAYLAALKATATSARWTEIKGAVEIGKSVPCERRNNLPHNRKPQSCYADRRKESVYRINDPMLKTLLLTSQIT